MSGGGGPVARRELPRLAAAFAALGFFWGTWAVTAADVRRFPALFNAGAVVGAAGSGAAIAAGQSWRWVWLAAGVAQLAVGLAVRRVELPAGVPGEQPSPWHAVTAIWRSRLVMLAIAFACGAVAEGGLDTWGVLFLRSQLAAGVLVGAGAYVVGQALATTGRVTLGSS